VINTNTYRSNLISDIRHYEGSGMLPREAFITVVCNKLSDWGEVVDIEPIYFQGSGRQKNKVEVHGWAFDNVDNSFHIVTSLYSDGIDNPEVITRSDCERMFKMARQFVVDSADGYLFGEGRMDESSPEYVCARKIKEQFDGTLSKVRFFLLTDRTLSDRVKDWPDGEIQGVGCDYRIWDLARMCAADQAQGGREQLEIDFTEFLTDGIPAIAEQSGNTVYRGYLGVIPGTTLASIYSRFGSRLLEGNVRAFLSARGKVNKGLQETIVELPHMFFAYNNGIAITASCIETKIGADGSLRIISAKDFQIVNGGQTTASLTHASSLKKADLSRVFVAAKFSVLDPDRAEELVPEISKYANSQNKVADSDLHSNKAFQRRMEQHSRSIRTGSSATADTFWYYERARGQYGVDAGRGSAIDQRAFAAKYPRALLVLKEDFARSEMSWLKFPHWVSKGRQKNFAQYAEEINKNWKDDEKKFDSTYYKESIARLIVFRAFELAFKNYNWFGGKMRAQIVTYSIARLASAVDLRPDRRQIDFARIWATQSAPREILQLLGDIGESIQLLLTVPPRGAKQQNEGEWCKESHCWTLVRDQPLPKTYDLLIQSLLVGAQEAQRRGPISEPELTELQRIRQVAAVGTQGWAHLLRWTSRHAQLEDVERRIVEKYTTYRGSPPANESLVLSKVLSRCQSAGFHLPVP
jgi:hypothetical protein